MSDPSRLLRGFTPAMAWLCVVTLFSSSLVAQEDVAEAAPKKPSKSEVVAEALRRWVHDFEAGEISVDGGVNFFKHSNVGYIRIALQGGAFAEPPESQSLTHFTMLQRLVVLAEKNPSKETAGALLALAATGFAHDMFNHKTMMVRDLGHFALLRVDALSAWEHVHSVAKTELVKLVDGDEVVSVDEIDPLFDVDARAMWRIAAIRLLGMKEKSVFRSSIEKCLLSSDGRVRLAAAESLSFLHTPESLSVVTRAMASETHPMVVVALIQTIQRTLNKHVEFVEEEVSERALRAALGLLGEHGWRGDMAIVQLIHNHPVKAAVEPFIRLMRQSRGEVDPILKIVNKNASRFLGLEAHRALKRITGAIIVDDPAKWEEFWASKKNEIVVKRRGPADKSRTYAARRGGSFYGIPVLGCEVVFVIDTSGSMSTRVKAKIPVGSKGKMGTMRGTRLAVAKRQTLKAIQGMPKHSRFSIVTFSSTVRAWNAKPVVARVSARRTAASILGKLKPHGGTNVFDALVHVLEARDMGYGSKPTTNVDEVFVLSDGRPSGGVLTDPKEILRVIKAINKIRKIRIHCVFAGEGDDKGASFMRQLAEENGGVFVQN